MNLELLERLLIVDGHSGSGFAPAYVPALKAGHVGAYCAAIGWMKSARETLDDMARVTRWLEEAAGDAVLATSVQEIEAARRAGKIAVIMEFENTLPLEGEVHLIDTFYRLGVRVMQLTYNERNLVGDGCTERTDVGLSDFGVQVVQRMNELGMVISLSHTGRRTSLEAIELSQKPCMFSHSNPRARCDHPRNIDDEEILACAGKGGVIGICAFANFLRTDSTIQRPATIEDFLDHLEYVVRLAGIDHVGVGLDLVDGEAEFSKTGVMSSRNFSPARASRLFKPEYYPPIDAWHGASDLDSIDKMPHVVDGLTRRGYGEEDLRKIMGGNFLRLFREVWGS